MLLNDSVKVINSCTKHDMDLNNYVSKVVGSSRFPLSKSLRSYKHNIVLRGAIMKPPKDIKYVLVGCNSFLKSPKEMKVCLVIIYIQLHISDSEGIKKNKC